MLAFDQQFTNGAPTISGKSTLQQETETIIRTIDSRLADLDEALLTALDKIVDEQGGIQYEPKPLNEIATTRPNTGPVQMNNQRLEGLATVPDVGSLDSILATPKTAVNVDTLSAYTTLSLTLNTAYCGPLSSDMSVKDKRVTNMADAQLVTVDDPDGVNKIKQGMNYGTVNTLCLTTAPEDRSNFYAGNKRIYELGVESLTNTEMDNFDSGMPSAEVLKKVSQAVNLQYALEKTVHAKARDPADSTVPAQTSCFDAQLVNIQNGRRGVLPLDYVIKEQAVCEEEHKLEEVVGATEYNHVDLGDSETIYTCNDPKGNLGGVNPNFTIKGSVPSQSVPKNRQLANLKYVDAKAKEEADKKHAKNENVDLGNSYRCRNALPAEQDSDYVTNAQCKSRQGKSDTGDVDLLAPITGGLAGAITGALAGGVSSMFGNSLSGGLAAFGSLAGAGASAFASGMQVGSSAALEGAKAGASSGRQQLIDNLKDDIANGGSGSGDPVQAGNLFSGASLFDGLVRLTRNAQVGLFDLA